MTIQQATLCLLTRNILSSQVLLGLKKIGFGQGKLTGFGGKVESGETIANAAQRELFEEAGISVAKDALIPAGTLTFLFPHQPSWSQEVYVFRVDSWEGDPAESDEMRPEWFEVDHLPFDRMWEDGRYWLPTILAGLTYSAQFTFKADNATMDQVTRESSSAPIFPVPFSLAPLLASTLYARCDLLQADPHHTQALRLFNGFLEGCPQLVADLYADTLVLQNHATPHESTNAVIKEAQLFYRKHLPWIRCVVVKTRSRKNKPGAFVNHEITHGNSPAQKIREHGVWYALELLRHQDPTFYPDTRHLRRWAIDHLAGQSVLNTFAYSGSLGVAALKGGSQQVIQLDLNRNFLNLAKTSYTLNGFTIRQDDFIAGDFFPAISALKRQGARFDCIFLDPPYFSVTNKGRVDLVSQSARLINKVRPLIADGGWLVSINNALFVSGEAYLSELQALCADGYLSIEELIPVPDDCAGYPATRIRSLPVDPAPFNHATKIVILRVRRKPSPDSALENRQE